MAIINRKIKIFDGQTGKNPIQVKFSLPDFKRIIFSELTVNLGGTEGLFDIPLTNWKIKKLVLNGFTFFPSSPRTSITTVHNDTVNGQVVDTRTGIKKALEIQDNNLLIFYEAPLGTGVTSPEVPIDATLFVQGEEENDPSKKVAAFSGDIVNQFSNLFGKVQTGAEKATVPSIIILVLIAVIVIAIAWIFTRGAVISTAAQSATGEV